MGAISDRADRFVARLLGQRSKPAAEAHDPKVVSLYQRLKKRRQGLKQAARR